MVQFQESEGAHTSELKRYNIARADNIIGVAPVKSYDGRWVEFADVDAELTRLRKELEEERFKYMKEKSLTGLLQIMNERLRSVVEAAKDVLEVWDALESTERNSSDKEKREGWRACHAYKIETLRTALSEKEKL